MPDINLLQTPNAQGNNFSKGSSRLLSRILMVALVAVVLGYVYMKYDHWATAKKITDIQTSVASAQAEALTSKDRNQLITRQGQTKELDKLIGSHLYWSYLLPELARVSLTSAKYTSIEADSDGKLTLNVNLNSYEDLEKYMQIFDLPEYNQEFSDVKIISIARVQVDSQLQTQARIQLTFDPTFLKGHM
jgi:hypothetical protein